MPNTTRKPVPIPRAVAATRDPFGDGPFVYRKLGEGFELTSALTYRERPVTLTVGR